MQLCFNKSIRRQSARVGLHLFTFRSDYIYRNNNCRYLQRAISCVNCSYLELSGNLKLSHKKKNVQNSTGRLTYTPRMSFGHSQEMNKEAGGTRRRKSHQYPSGRMKLNQVNIKYSQKVVNVRIKVLGVGCTFSALV